MVCDEIINKKQLFILYDLSIHTIVVLLKLIAILTSIKNFNT